MSGAPDLKPWALEAARLQSVIILLVPRRTQAVMRASQKLRRNGDSKRLDRSCRSLMNYLAGKIWSMSSRDKHRAVLQALKSTSN